MRNTVEVFDFKKANEYCKKMKEDRAVFVPELDEPVIVLASNIDRPWVPRDWQINGTDNRTIKLFGQKPLNNIAW